MMSLTQVSPHGVWLLLRGEEPAPGHLYWPDLDVDLGLETIRHPERFPLKSRAR